MASTTTIKSRVLQVLGQDIGDDYLDDINAPEELWSNAVWDIITKLPHRLLLTDTAAQPNPESLVTGDECPGDNTSVVDTKILVMFRSYANHIMDGESISTERYITKPVKKTTLEQSLKALDPESIYYATQTSPVYWVDNIAGVPCIKTAPITGGTKFEDNTIMPLGTAALRIYSVKRHAYNASGTLLDGTTDVDPSNWDIDTQFPLSIPAPASGIYAEVLPVECEDVVIKRIAQAILQEKMAKASVGDEDNEVAELLVSNIKMLSEDIMAQLETIQKDWEE